MKKRCRVCLCLLVCLLLLPCLTLALSAAETTTTPPVRYGGTTLTGNARYVYDRLVNGLTSSTPLTKISFDVTRKVSKSDMDKGFNVFLSDYPECFFISGGYYYYQSGSYMTHLEPKYHFKGEALKQAQKALNREVEAILAGMPSGSTYDKALYLHDQVAKKVTYKEVGYHQTAYGALVAGKAVCAGYAAAYQLLLNRAGIQAWTVAGEAMDPDTNVMGSHAWNVVWMDKDTCVYSDVTWDDKGEDIYRSYFNISLSEMEKRHKVNATYFRLPACSHDDQSYFDHTGYVVTDQTFSSEIAGFFGPIVNGWRQAFFYYKGSAKLANWLDSHLSGIYRSMGGTDGSFYYQYNQYNNEVMLAIKGNFSITYYTLNVMSNANIKGDQTMPLKVNVGQTLTGLVYTAMDGYYFPEDYHVNPVNGLTVTRNSATQIIISGKLTANTTIHLPDPSPRSKANVPNATFTATGDDSGILSGLSTQWQYSLDGGAHWETISSHTVNIPIGITTTHGVQVRDRGNGGDVQESDVQRLATKKADAPTTVVPSGDAQNGKLTGVTADMEYRRDGTYKWIDCAGTEVSGLGLGTYYVRFKASGDVLASDSQVVTIVCPHTNKNKIQSDTPPCLPGGFEEYYACASCGRMFAKDGTTPITSPVTTLHNYGTLIPAQDEVHAKGELVAAMAAHYQCLGCQTYFTINKQMTKPEALRGRTPVHTYAKDWTVDGTHHWHACECGEEADKAEHVFGEWTVLTEPTKEAAGQRERACACGYVESEEVPMPKPDIPVAVIIAVAASAGVVVVVAVVLIVRRKKTRAK